MTQMKMETRVLQIEKIIKKGGISDPNVELFIHGWDNDMKDRKNKTIDKKLGKKEKRKEEEENCPSLGLWTLSNMAMWQPLGFENFAPV